MIDHSRRAALNVLLKWARVVGSVIRTTELPVGTLLRKIFTVRWLSLLPTLVIATLLINLTYTLISCEFGP